MTNQTRLPLGVPLFHDNELAKEMIAHLGTILEFEHGNQSQSVAKAFDELYRSRLFLRELYGISEMTQSVNGVNILDGAGHQDASKEKSSLAYRWKFDRISQMSVHDAVAGVGGIMTAKPLADLLNSSGADILFPGRFVLIYTMIEKGEGMKRIRFSRGRPGDTDRHWKLKADNTARELKVSFSGGGARLPVIEPLLKTMMNQSVHILVQVQRTTPKALSTRAVALFLTLK